jgi:D-lactate dehydrogenase
LGVGHARPGAGPAPGDRARGRRRRLPPRLPQALVDVSRRAGLPLWIPDDAAGHCCALPWSSKGFRAGHEQMSGRLAASMRRWTGDGTLPVVVDAASCTQAVAEIEVEGIEVIDAVAWAHDRLLPALEVRQRVGSATVHPTCSTRHLGLAPRLEALTRALAEEVHVPIVATCCGMAGDRGLLHPELTAAATAPEAAEVTARSFAAHVSSNRTCELALEQATGRPYVSVIALLERVTR